MSIKKYDTWLTQVETLKSQGVKNVEYDPKTKSYVKADMRKVTDDQKQYKGVDRRIEVLKTRKAKSIEKQNKPKKPKTNRKNKTTATNNRLREKTVVNIPISIGTTSFSSPRRKNK